MCRYCEEPFLEDATVSLDPKKHYLPDRTEEPFEGMVVDWYNREEVIVYKLLATSPIVVNRWAEFVQNRLEDWPKDRPYLAVHDLSQPGISLQYAALVKFDMMNIGVTDEGRVLAERLFDKNRGWLARVAVNFNLSLSGQTNRTLMSYLNRDHPSIRYKTFYNRTKCLRWVTTGLTDTSEMKALDEANDDSETDNDQ